MVDIELTPPPAITVEVGSLTTAIEQALASKANAGHDHVMSSVSGLQQALDQKNVLIDGAITAHLAADNPHPGYATDSDLAAHATGTGAGGHLPSAGITNSHVAPGAAIEWDKLSKTGAAPGDVGAAAASHTHAGVPYVGSSAPSSPTVGDRWLDTGDRLVWFWSGAYWLSEEIFPAQLTSVGSIAFNTAYNLYIRRFTVVALTGATHDSSNYWSLNLTRRSTSANTTITTISTQAIAANTPFSLSQQLNLHLDAAALSTLYLRITASTTGSPSGMSETSYLVTYRLAKP